MLIQVLFYLFARILVVAALGVITARNPVHAALCLVLCFFTCAAIWLLIEAEFLADRAGAGLRRRRHGAVPVRGDDARHQRRRSCAQGFTRFAWLGWLTALAVIVEIVGVVWARGGLGLRCHAAARTPQPADYSNTTELGTLLYTKYVYPLEIAAVLLLVAIVAAITLTMRQPRGPQVAGHQRQQVRGASAQDRVRIVQAATADAEKRAMITPRHSC